MRVRYILDGKARTIDLPKGSTLKGLVEKIGFNSETVLLRVGGEIVPEDTKITGKEKIEILKVVSGG